MRRSEFITLLGGAAASWPLAARAQPAMPVIGFLSSLAHTDLGLVIPGFHEGLNGAGFFEGRNIQIDHRYAAGDVGRMHVFAKELVGLAARKQVEREGLIPSPKRREDARRQRPRPF